jgi:carbon catabolite-derepressing protein kinase
MNRLYVGPEVDIWSCGVILYVMLCSRLPFDDDFIPTLFKKILNAAYSVPSYLSTHAKQFIASMLTVDPMKRITISEMKENAWFNVDIPEHLFPSSEDEMEERTVIEETIIQEIKEVILIQVSF